MKWNNTTRNVLGTLVIISNITVVLIVVYALWHFLTPKTLWQKLVMIVIEIVIAINALMTCSYPTSWALEKLGFC